MIEVRPARSDDAEAWLRMRELLWPDGSAAEHAGEIRQFFAGTFPRRPWAVLLAFDEACEPLGFVELSVRPYAEGCESHRVGYLEGWFVAERARGSGVGAALLNAGEDWARAQGCREFASDVDPSNAVSLAAHRALGFADAGVVQCFRKDL
ncbi:MAG: GNAT family N-acetyltransferase [bacterium]|nr:GNAT family N-acetyltransferase [bacterium]